MLFVCENVRVDLNQALIEIQSTRSNERQEIGRGKGVYL